MSEGNLDINLDPNSVPSLLEQRLIRAIEENKNIQKLPPKKRGGKKENKKQKTKKKSKRRLNKTI